MLWGISKRFESLSSLPARPKHRLAEEVPNIRSLAAPQHRFIRFNPIDFDSFFGRRFHLSTITLSSVTSQQTFRRTPIAKDRLFFILSASIPFASTSKLTTDPTAEFTDKPLRRIAPVVGALSKVGPRCDATAIRSSGRDAVLYRDRDGWRLSLAASCSQRHSFKALARRTKRIDLASSRWIAPVQIDANGEEFTSLQIGLPQIGLPQIGPATERLPESLDQVESRIDDAGRLRIAADLVQCLGRAHRVGLIHGNLSHAQCPSTPGSFFGPGTDPNEFQTSSPWTFPGNHD